MCTDFVLQVKCTIFWLNRGFDNGARIEIDTTKTDTRRSSKRFNYGYTVEHGRGASEYKTTPYWYDNVMRNLSLIDKKIKNVLAKAAMNKTK